MIGVETGSLLKQYAAVVESFLDNHVARALRSSAVSGVSDVVLYSLQAGGKRIRPVLTLLSGGVVFENPERGSEELTPEQIGALFVASSLEAIHTYSLIHDDLPAMDDDDLRRGRPSCHVAFSEWEAILAGDALNTFAFELLALGVNATSPGHVLHSHLTILARAAGVGGMVCGQVLDMRAEKDGLEKASLEEKRELLDRIHLSKTAAMMRASVEMGGVLAGVSHRESHAKYGEGLGLLFQITDDILDVVSDSGTLGKTAGKDERSGKLTYPSLYGIEESRKKASQLSEMLRELALELPLGENQKHDFRPQLAEIPALLEQRLH